MPNPPKRPWLDAVTAAITDRRDALSPWPSDHEAVMRRTELNDALAVIARLTPPPDVPDTPGSYNGWPEWALDVELEWHSRYGDLLNERVYERLPNGRLRSVRTHITDARLEELDWLRAMWNEVVPNDGT